MSASPELFLARRGHRVWTAPIKGTRPLGDDDLMDSEKDAAEHVMIVDLERNDLSRVCEPGTVRWPGLMTEQELAGVKHLVTRVEGRLRDGVGLAELLEATFPGGSRSGGLHRARGERERQPGLLWQRRVVAGEVDPERVRVGNAALPRERAARQDQSGAGGSEQDEDAEGREGHENSLEPGEGPPGRNRRGRE